MGNICLKKKKCNIFSQNAAKACADLSDGLVASACHDRINCKTLSALQ